MVAAVIAAATKQEGCGFSFQCGVLAHTETLTSKNTFQNNTNFQTGMLATAVWDELAAARFQSGTN